MAIALLALTKKNLEIKREKSDVDFVDGLFLMCVCNVISHHMGLSLEKTSMPTLIKRFAIRFDQSESIMMADVIHNYNEMIAREEDGLRMIFATTRRWLINPNKETLDELREVYSLILRHLK
jgi:hypothetical protein